MKHLNPDQKIRRFINKVVLLKDEAARLGLFETMHALDGAVKKVGYEVAEKMERERVVTR